jgi:ABC-type uncharacterized transport system ATPase subunit
MNPQFLHDLLMEFARTELSDDHAEVSIGRTAHGRLYAVLASNRFDNMEVTERQDRIWSFLRQRLSAEERQQISAIFAKGVMEAVVEEHLSDSSQELLWLR